MSGFRGTHPVEKFQKISKKSMSPEMEAFFVFLALEESAILTAGGVIDARNRDLWIQVIGDYIRHHPGVPKSVQDLRANYTEFGGSLLGMDEGWFYRQIAYSYYRWKEENQSGG